MHNLIYSAKTVFDCKLGLQNQVSNGRKQYTFSGIKTYDYFSQFSGEHQII